MGDRGLGSVVRRCTESGNRRLLASYSLPQGLSPPLLQGLACAVILAQWKCDAQGLLQRPGSCSLARSAPTASSRRRQLARRPGYLRTMAGPGIEFLSPNVGTGGVCSQESHGPECRAGWYSPVPGGQGRGPSAGIPVPEKPVARAVTSAGRSGLALTSVLGTAACFGLQCRAGPRRPGTRTRLCGLGNSGDLPELTSMDSVEVPGATWEAARGEAARGTQATGPGPSAEINGLGCGPGSAPSTSSALRDSQDVFASSFSFIQLSLGSAGERGEAEGCLPREAECPGQSAQEVGAKALSSHGPHQDPQYLSPSSADSAQAAGSSRGPELGVPALLDMDPGFSWSPDSLLASRTGDESSSSEDSRGWDALLRSWEPALRDCLLSNRRWLEVTSLRLKLQKLQAAAVEDDDYDQAEIFKQRLEDLEQERSGLHFQLPSRWPGLSSFLDYLAAQAQAALSQRAARQANSGDIHSPLGAEQRPLEPTAQDNLRVAITRRDWLLQEKQQLQKEIEALQARMSLLEAKDQQLRKEIEEQERRLQWQDCDLTLLMGRLTPAQLQGLSKALCDTLACANQILLQAEPPETIRSSAAYTPGCCWALAGVYERGTVQLSQEENRRRRSPTPGIAGSQNAGRISTVVEMGSASRLRPGHAGLWAVAEGKASGSHYSSASRLGQDRGQDRGQALGRPIWLCCSWRDGAGNHFRTAKDLAEEMRSLASEREALEGLLGTLLALSSRTVHKLGSVNEECGRLTRELERQEAAYGTSVRENTAKYMEMLEGTLCRTLRQFPGYLSALSDASMVLIQGPEVRTLRQFPGYLSALSDASMVLIQGPEVRPGTDTTIISTLQVRELRLSEGQSARYLGMAARYQQQPADSVKCPLLRKVWEADLEACRLFVQSLQLQEDRGNLAAEERQLTGLEGAVCTVAQDVLPSSHSKDERRTSLQPFEEPKVHPPPSPHSAGEHRQVDDFRGYSAVEASPPVEETVGPGLIFDGGAACPQWETCPLLQVDDFRGYSAVEASPPVEETVGPGLIFDGGAACPHTVPAEGNRPMPLTPGPGARPVAGSTNLNGAGSAVATGSECAPDLREDFECALGLCEGFECATGFECDPGLCKGFEYAPGLCEDPGCAPDLCEGLESAQVVYEGFECALGLCEGFECAPGLCKGPGCAPDQCEVLARLLTPEVSLGTRTVVSAKDR
ncbi:Disrupted in schizophrenia 1 protein [Tupaia chinensis]|uniref:Disrupted in schizophrenia 1 protein n=1 Tax=Tupaia chinensis TaxID=246437 RepID=L9L426_TUPCH|nr:Disrupted in schizophrenia 1 protein [Tupaia chinensis]